MIPVMSLRPVSRRYCGSPSLLTQTILGHALRTLNPTPSRFNCSPPSHSVK
jgi:hypothetical protein